MARGWWGTSWKWQPRDKKGRWTKSGARKAFMQKAARTAAYKKVNEGYKAKTNKMWRSNSRTARTARNLVTNASIIANNHVSYSVNPYRTSGGVTVSAGKNLKYIPTHRLNVSLSVGIAPRPGTKSYFEKQTEQLGNRVAAKVGEKLQSKAAHDAVQVALGQARTVTVLGSTLAASGNRRRSGTTLRSSTPQQRLKAARKMQRDRIREENKRKRNLTADQKNGVPSTVTGAKVPGKKPRPARRNQAANTRLKGGVSKSRVVRSSGNTGHYAPPRAGKTKAKKKSAGTYTR